MGGGEGSSGPTVQQQQLETQQGLTNANLNLEENSQRKAILNSMMGTRVFAGSALSRAVRGNTPGVGGVAGSGPASASQTNDEEGPIGSAKQSLLDARAAGAAGATPAGGTGGSGVAAAGGGVRGGGSGRGMIP